MPARFGGSLRWWPAAATSRTGRSIGEGLSNGTDPEHPDYWGDIGDIDQRQVELAAIGFALRIARAELWDPLDDAAKQRIAAYLVSGREHEFVDSNWKFFRVMIDLGLMHCGVEVGAEKRNAYLDDIERFAIGNGWYRDGPIRSVDHYMPFAFHYYGLIYAALSDDAKRGGALSRARRATFARSIRHWYAPDGSALPFGRSLTYRFAHAGFWGALAFAGVEALPWGQIKGYYLRNLRWWAGQPIFDRDGVLSVGYAYPNLLMSESYNSAGSPYWALKAFLPLALAEDHPFWAAEEAEPETFDAPVPLPEPGMVVAAPSRSHRGARLGSGTRPVARHTGEVRQVRLFHPLRLLHRGQRPALSERGMRRQCSASPMTACICACARATRRR